MWGSPYVELTDTSAIQSSTGYTAAVSLRSAQATVRKTLTTGRSTTRAKVGFPARRTRTRLSSPTVASKFKHMKVNGPGLPVSVDPKVLSS